MFAVSEIVKYARVSIVKAKTMGHLYPILSASFPDGIRERVFVVPPIPKRRAIREGTKRRLFSAYTAKRVIKKAYVNEKLRRR